MRSQQAHPPAVVFITYHYPPSTQIGARRTGALVTTLGGEGIHVIVVSRFADGPLELHPATDTRITFIQVPESRKLITRWLVAAKRRIRRMWTPRRGGEEGSEPAREAVAPKRRSLWSDQLVQFIESLDRYKMWSWRAARAAYFAGKRFDAQVVIASGPPMTNLLAGYWVARLRKIPFIADFRDPWYVGFERWPGPSALERRLRSAFERTLLEGSTAITVTTDPLAERLRASYASANVKIHVVRNGFDGSPRGASTATGHRLGFLYAGEIYMTRDPFPFLAALERLVSLPQVDSSRVSATFVGECASYRGMRLLAWLRGRKCEALVRVLEPVTPPIAQAMIAESSVLLNLAQASPLTVPAKTYEHLASGREMLVMCEAGGATARLVEGIPGVISVDPSDGASLDRALADLYRRHVIVGELTAPPASIVGEFSREVQTRKFFQLVQTMLR
jgi:hypothetical protein